MERVLYNGQLLWRWDDPDNPYHEYIEAYNVFPWALDFCRKIYEFGRIRRFLFRLMIGRHAFREFIGIRDAIEKADYDPRFEYSCEKCEYHKDKVGW